MRRKIVLAIIIIVCFLLQSSIFKALSVVSASPNLLIVVTASFGFMRGKKEGLFVGFFCGLLMDIMSGNILGFYALIFMYIGFINGFANRIFYPDDFKLPVTAIAASDFCANIVIYFMMFLLRGRFSFGYYLIHTIIPELVYTMIVSIVLYFILLKINGWLETFEKRSAAKFV